MLGCFAIIRWMRSGIGVMNRIIGQYVAVPSNFNWSPQVRYGVRILLGAVVVIVDVIGVGHVGVSVGIMVMILVSGIIARGALLFGLAGCAAPRVSVPFVVGDIEIGINNHPMAISVSGRHHKMYCP